jgi:glycosyltransferase involved in cell wall biosynthesis
MRRLRVLLQNRAGAREQPGGDLVLMERYRRELERLGHRADLAFGPADPSAYDMVHLFNLTLPGITGGYARAAVAAGVPFVVTALHEDWQRTLRPRVAAQEIFRRHLAGEIDEHGLRRALEDLRRIPPGGRPGNDLAASHAACLLASGESERVRLRRDYPLARRVEVLRFGADAPAEAGAAGDFAARHGIGDYALCVGRLETRKNQLMLLQALRNDPIALVFATGGFTWPDQQAYADLCRSFPRRAPTLFLGRLDAAELAAAYRGARALLMPSWEELPGLVALEAAALGCPVVASSTGTLHDYLGDAAVWCDPGNPESIRQALFIALSAPPAAALAERAREHGWERAALQLVQLYASVLAADPRRAGRLHEAAQHV